MRALTPQAPARLASGAEPAGGDASSPVDVAVLHDMQQPVAALRLLLETLPDASLGRRQVQRLRDVTLEEIAVMQRLVSACLDASVEGRGRGQGAGRVAEAETDEATSFDAVVRAVAAPFLAVSDNLLLTQADEVVVAVPPLKLRRVVANFVHNAVRAAGTSHGRTEIGLRRVGDTAVLVVDDAGPGFGAVPTGHGRGFLDSVAVVTRFGGSVQILPSPLGGTRIRISLPVVGR